MPCKPSEISRKTSVRRFGLHAQDEGLLSLLRMSPRWRVVYRVFFGLHRILVDRVGPRPTVYSGFDRW
jgi:hypothetical protein